jgi:hypothetical protein
MIDAVVSAQALSWPSSAGLGGIVGMALGQHATVNSPVMTSLQDGAFARLGASAVLLGIPLTLVEQFQSGNPMLFGTRWIGPVLGITRGCRPANDRPRRLRGSARDRNRPQTSTTRLKIATKPAPCSRRAINADDTPHTSWRSRQGLQRANRSATFSSKLPVHQDGQQLHR